MRYLLISFLCLGLFLSSCNKPYYQAKQFKKITSHHKEIAVLPPEMILTGFRGLQNEAEALDEVLNAESRAFQISLQNELLKSTKNGKRSMKVRLQPVSRTNKLLAENEISIKDSWAEDPQELAEILGVDAVLQSRVEKKRYFSDLASYGIDIGVKVIGILSKNILPLLANTGLDKSNDIYSNMTLVNANDGEVLWTISGQIEADWSQPSNLVIDDLNAALVKHFPYRR